MVEHHDNFEATPFCPGERIGHYELLEEFGRGGMGVVYKAQDLNLDRVVALKCPWRTFTKDELAIRRFVREGKLASSLTHPNIIPVYEVFEHDDHPWLAMQLLTRGSLKRKLVREGKTSPVQVARFGEGLASALQHAHENAVLHRDLNPNNILIGANDQPLITDFGLAKRIFHTREDSGDTSQLSTLTGEGVVMGTLNYMSPEQARGRSLDGRSDIFSLGSVLYEMCTGVIPFKNASRKQVIDAIVHRDPAPIGQDTYEVPAELERIIRKCMARKVEERYQEPRDLVVDLRTLRRDLECRENFSSRVVADAPKSKRFFCLVLLVVGSRRWSVGAQ